MAYLIRLRCEGPPIDMPSSPFSARAEVPIQGEIHPPPHPISLTEMEEVNKTETDYIIHQRVMVFVVNKQKETMSRYKKYALNNGKRRLAGNVPDIFSNWKDRSYELNPHVDMNIRFGGMSLDSALDGLSSMNYPESDGRLAFCPKGAFPAVFDDRFFDNPQFGDILEWFPVDSGRHIIPGSTEYSLPIVRNLKPHQVHGLGGAGIGIHDVIHGTRAPDTGRIDEYLLSANILNQVAIAKDDAHVTATDNPDTQREFAYMAARTACKVWHLKPLGIPTGANVMTGVTTDKMPLNALWLQTGLSDTHGSTTTHLTDLLRYFGVNDNGVVVDDVIAADSTATGMHLFVRREANGGQFRLNPFLRLPMKRENNQLSQDAALFGSKTAPGFVYQAANALSKIDASQSWWISQDSPLYIRITGEWKTGPADTAGFRKIRVTPEGAGVPSDVDMTSIDFAAAEALFTRFTAAYDGPLRFDALTEVDETTVGIKGNPNTNATVYQAKINNTNAYADKVTAAKDIDQFIGDLVGQLNATKVGGDAADRFKGGGNPDSTTDDVVDALRFTVGGDANAINKALTRFCQICDGGGPGALVHSVDAAGALIFKDHWEGDAVLTEDMKKYLKDHYLKHFAGFPPSIVMAAIAQNSADHPFWIEHPATREMYEFTDHVDLDLPHMLLSNFAPSAVKIPLEIYFGVQYRTGGEPYARATDIWHPPTAAARFTLAQTFANIGLFHMHEDAPEVFKEAHVGIVSVPSSAPFQMVGTNDVMKSVMATSRDSIFTDIDSVDPIKEILKGIKPDPRRCFAVFIGQNEADPCDVTIMLRDHMPTH